MESTKKNIFFLTITYVVVKLKLTEVKSIVSTIETDLSSIKLSRRKKSDFK